MCLAVPGKIVALQGENAVIDFNGVRRTAVISLIADPKVGEHVIVHAGFAIQKWSDRDVKEYNAIMKEIEGLK